MINSGKSSDSVANNDVEEPQKRHCSGLHPSSPHLVMREKEVMVEWGVVKKELLEVKEGQYLIFFIPKTTESWTTKVPMLAS